MVPCCNYNIIYPQTLVESFGAQTKHTKLRTRSVRQRLLKKAWAFPCIHVHIVPCSSALPILAQAASRNKKASRYWFRIGMPFSMTCASERDWNEDELHVKGLPASLALATVVCDAPL